MSEDLNSPAGTAARVPLEDKPPSGVARYVPILQWLPKYRGR
jgi:hypothetical protein